MSPINPIRLGENLKQARKAKALRQEAVALELGLARTTITAIEQGARKVTEAELIAFSELYSCPTDVLLNGVAMTESQTFVAPADTLWASISRTEFLLLKAVRDGDYHQALMILLMAIERD